MKPNKDGGPAFPTCVAADNGGGLNYGLPGMTLRDWFAGQAMQGIIAATWDDKGSPFSTHAIVSDAYRIADAMIAAREGGGS